MGVVAILHDLVRLHGLVQDAAEVSSLCGRVGREVRLEGTSEKDRGKRRELGALSTVDDMAINKKDMLSVCVCTCTERLVEVSRGSSVPALVEFGSQLVVCRLFIIQHLQRLKTTQHTNIRSSDGYTFIITSCNSVGW